LERTRKVHNSIQIHTDRVSYSRNFCIQIFAGGGGGEEWEEGSFSEDAMAAPSPNYSDPPSLGLRGKPSKTHAKCSQ